MIPFVLPMALAAAPAALPANSLPANSLVVFGREPICHMGRTTADGTKVRIECHPQDDSYHLVVSGPAIAALATAAPAAPAAAPQIVVKSGFDRHFYRGSIIPGNPDIPAAAYAPLTYPEQVIGSQHNKWPRNKAIEQRLFDQRGLDIMVDDKIVARLDGKAIVEASRELIKCSNRFALGGRSPADMRRANYFKY